MRTAPADPAAAAAYVQLRLILYMVEDDQERTKAHSLTVVSAGHESTRPCYHQLLLPVNLLRHSWGSLPPRSDVIECNYRAHRQTHGQTVEQTHGQTDKVAEGRRHRRTV